MFDFVILIGNFQQNINTTTVVFTDSINFGLHVKTIADR